MDSKPGKGASFWFTLRFAKQNTNSTAHEVPDVQLRGLPVLVVDPSRVARESLVEMLGAWGCRSDQAETGEEALQLMHTAAERGEPYRVAIVDMQLPGMDGEQLGSAIRSEPAFENTLLMLLTSVGRRGDAVRVQALGFSAYLLKPVQWSELYDAMAEVVARGPVPVGVPVSLVTRHSLAEARRGRLRILLVEDNEVNRLVADWALRRLGYTLDVATSAGEALQMCEKQSFDLIFMDFQMPDMDGLKAASAIRARERNGKRTPIVMMAGSPVPGDRDRAMAAGMDEFLQKPIDLGLLSQVVQRFTVSRPGLTATAEPLEADEANPGTPAAQPARSHGFGEVEITGSDASVGRIGDGLGEPMPALDGEPRPIIDTARLEESCMGIPALRDALLQTFINDIGSRMTRLTEAVVSHDARRIEFEAHNLKGMSATIGAGGCAEVFAEIERLAKDEQVVDIHPLMNRANQEVERAESYIRRLESILSRAA
jgi:CheY-like chemotaxis protein/HPt (histidine-containing phosphotransfer) domain-containing protein